MPLSPYNFQARYKNLSGAAVPPKEAAPFAFSGIRCDRYVMTGNAEFGEAEAALAKVTQNAAGRKPTQDELAVVAKVKYGKGSPDEMEAVLKLAVETGAASPTAEALQKFADKALGVDCTGMASSYYEQFDGSLNGKKLNVGCGYFFQKYKAGGGPIVWAGDYAESGDCMLWMHADGQESRKPGHIAVIEGSNGPELFAVQSGSTKSGGPRRSTHVIEDIVHRKVIVGKEAREEAFYLRLQETDPVSGTKAEVIIVRPYVVA